MMYKFWFLSLLLLQTTDSAAVAQSDEDATAYLTKYGYALQKCSGNNTFHMMREPTLSSMIENYQRQFKLPLTGKLDFETKQLMSKPRCGHSDRELASTLSAQSINGDHKWNHRRLTWSFRRNDSTYADWIERAFRKWKEIIPQFDFIQVCSTCDADIKLSFQKANHSDGEINAFNPQTLAHAFHPKDGTIHFNFDQTWTHDFGRADNLYNFYLVAVHEIGHALGYVYNGQPHNVDDRESIMFPSYGEWDKDNLFRETDKQAMKNVYGTKSLSVLAEGQRLNMNEQLNAPDNRYTLRMQSDGNLVLYKHDSGGSDSPKWDSKTAKRGTPPYHAILQSDGNFVVYDGNHHPLWATGTKETKYSTHLVMQDDGNLVLYKNILNSHAIWASRTHEKVRNK